MYTGVFLLPLFSQFVARPFVAEPLRGATRIRYPAAIRPNRNPCLATGFHATRRLDRLVLLTVSVTRERELNDAALDNSTERILGDPLALEISFPLWSSGGSQSRNS